VKVSDLDRSVPVLEAVVELNCVIVDRLVLVGEVVVDEVVADDNVGPKIVVRPTYGSTLPILFCAASVNHRGG
jgi:hypothetical protein